MPKVILKNVTTTSNNKLSQLDAGEIAIVTDPSKPSIAFKDKNNSLTYINQTEFEVWDSQESAGSVDKNGFYFNKTNADLIQLTGNFTYDSIAPASGGTIYPANTLRLLKNGIPQSNVTFSYTSDQLYAIVGNEGEVTFTGHTNPTQRSANITVKCIYGDYERVKIATVTQSKYVPDTITIEGTFSYNGNVAATGGVINISSNTLKLKKNGVVQTDAAFTYSLKNSSSFATVNFANGSVTFQNNTGASRNVQIIATCVYDGQPFVSNAVTVTQSAYVAPEDVYTITGNLIYSGSVDANGGTIVPTNTLGMSKNGTPVSGYRITYESNQPYANVAENGSVTFTASTSTTARTATITATVSYDGHSKKTTAVVTQSAYVEPSITGFIYAGGAAQPNPTISVEQFNEISSTAASNKEISFLINGYNIISVLCPENLTLTSCKIVPGVDDNIASKMSVTTVTYKNQTMKMYQYRYETGLVYNQNFVATFI